MTINQQQCVVGLQHNQWHVATPVARFRRSHDFQITIRCPHCATAKLELMPTDACRFFYECTGCGVKLRPKAGDCCVFCSYGSVPCPPIQGSHSGAAAASCCAPERPE